MSVLGAGKRWGQAVLLNIVVAVVYFVVARLSLLLAFGETNVSPVWPPSGIALSAVLLFGYRVSPGILLGAAVANFAVFHHNQAATVPLVALASLCIGFGNVAEVVAGRWLITHVAKLHGNPMNSVGPTFRLMVVCAAMGVVGAVIGPLALAATGVAPVASLPRIAFVWWLGDTMGVLILTPLFLAWRHRPVRDWLSERGGEALVSLAALVLLAWALFGGVFPADMTAPLPYLVVPFLFWIVFRYGPRLATLGLFIVTVVAVVGTTNGHGCFASTDLHQSLIHLQLFLGTIATTALGLSAAVSERAAAEIEVNRHRERLEKTVAARTEDLQRSNRDLEQFAYAASHDLQEPLRKIIAFGDRLLQVDRDNLSERGQDFLLRIVNSCARMRALIDDLLQFSRITMGASPFSDVDLSRTLSSVLTDLELMIQETGGRVEAGKLPTLEADPFQMRQLLCNLIINGLKFHRPGVPPVVSVHGRLYRQKGFGLLRGWRADAPYVCEIVVADSGCGFSEEHAERIFDVFKTLGEKRADEGTGIGLALCRKIVSRHGGTILVESAIGEGSRFTVTLPARQPTL